MFVAAAHRSLPCGAFVGVLFVALVAGCRVHPAQDGVAEVHLRNGYQRSEFMADLQKIRSAQWPERGPATDAFIRVHNNVEWVGVSREKTLEVLGAADGELAYRDRPATTRIDRDGKEIEIQEVEKAPFLTPPSDDRLIYRLGDGDNRGTIFIFRFEEGKVASVELGEGY